jgi:hypothetical protein
METAMSDTSSHKIPDTCAKLSAASGRLIKGVTVYSKCSTVVENGQDSGDVVVRIPKTQSKVYVKVNTRLIAEQREIERANEQNRRSGR